MSHRAEQIINAAAALHSAASDVAASVFTHRILSMNEDQGELPAFSITWGDDQPQTDNMGFIESLLTVRIMIFTVNVDEKKLREDLIAMRARSHRYVRADISLGLAFVTDTRYGGASEPQVIKNAQFAAALETRWHVLYRMNETDPE